MNDKMIFFWIAIILGSSMLLGKLLKLIPVIIKKSIEIGVPVLLVVNLVRNVFWVKELMPKLKIMALEANVQSILHRVVFYSYTVIRLIWSYVTELMNTI